MKKVLFLIPTLGHGGAERVLVNLVNHLDPDRFDITVQTLFDEGVNKQFLERHIRYKSFLKHQFRGNSPVLSLIPAKLLYRVAVKERYDIVISFLEGPTAHLIAGCPKGTKRVAWLHTAPSDKRMLAVGFSSYRKAVRLYQSVDRFVCVSNGVRAAVEELTAARFPNCCVRYNVVDSARIRSMANEAFSDVTFSKGSINVISVGKVQEVKGFDRLAHVHKRLMEERYPHHVYIVGAGGGAEQKRIEAYLEQHALTDSFTFLGFRENPYQYLSAADVYVCSSRREGFSGAITEALVLGLPVVSTKCSGVYEQLGDNQYGIVAENSEEGLYQGMKKMLSDAHTREYYKAQAAERGKFFAAEQTVQAVADMLLSL